MEARCPEASCLEAHAHVTSVASWAVAHGHAHAHAWEAWLLEAIHVHPRDYPPQTCFHDASAASLPLGASDSEAKFLEQSCRGAAHVHEASVALLAVAHPAKGRYAA